MSTATVAATATTRTLVPLYNGRCGELVIVSCDNVSFRVDGRDLKNARQVTTLSPFALSTDCASSPVFAHMLGDEHSIPTDIPLDEDAETLELFLKLACGIYVQDGPKFDLAQKVLEAGQKYDAPHVLEELGKLDIHMACTDAKQRFLFGCKVKSRKICENALGCMNYSQYPRMDQAFLDGISKQDRHDFHCAVWKSEPRRTYPSKPMWISRRWVPSWLERDGWRHF